MSHKALSTAETDRQFDPISLLADIWSWENQPSQSRARRHGGQWLSRITEIHHFLSDDKKCWSIVVALKRIIWRYLLVINSDLVYSYCLTSLWKYWYRKMFANILIQSCTLIYFQHFTLKLSWQVGNSRRKNINLPFISPTLTR